MGNCCRRSNDVGPISLLLLGYESSGKTEIGHIVTQMTRVDFTTTKGVRIFNGKVNEKVIKLIEIGGSDSVRDIWPHYYNEAYGVIYVIDCSLNAPFEITRAILHETMHHRHIRGKPLLIIANKQDIPDSIDVIDITYYFHIDEICNRLGTPCLIITSGEDNRQDITVGMDWIVEYVCSNYKALRNRIVFNDIPRSPQKRFIRQRTSVPTNRKKQATQRERIKSAPSTIGLGRSPKLNGHLSQVVPITERIIETPHLFRKNPIVVQHE